MAISILNRYGWAFAAIAVILLIALWTAPKAMFGACSMSCVAGTTFVEYPSEGEAIDLSGICNPTGQTCDCCEVTAVTPKIQLDGWQVDWECCNCVGEEGLPDCTMPFGFIHQIFGLCK